MKKLFTIFQTNRFKNIPLLVLLMVVCVVFTQAQTITDTIPTVIKGSRMYIKPGTSLFLNGSFYNIQNTHINASTQKGDVTNQDTIYVAGDIQNYVTDTLNKFFSYSLLNDSVSGAVRFRYDFVQRIKGSRIRFNDMILSKSANDLVLSRNIEVGGGINFLQGNFSNLNFNVDLGFRGRVLNETDNKRFIGEIGKIIARRRNVEFVPISLGDVGIALVSTSSALGAVTLYRRNIRQNNAANGSLRRYYDIQKVAQTSFKDFYDTDESTSGTNNVNIEGKYLDVDYQNLTPLINETRLGLWRTAVNATVEQPAGFTKVRGSNPQPLANKVSKLNQPIVLPRTRITIADTICDILPQIPLQTYTHDICPGDSVVLLGGNEGVIYEWNPIGVYTQNLTFKYNNFVSTVDTITLYIESSNGCSNGAKFVLRKRDKPVAKFVAPFSQLCLGNEITFNNQSTVAAPASLNYLWTFGDSTTSNQQNPIKSYNTFGTYTVKLAITSSFNCKHDTSRTITINDLPTASFNTSTTAICVDQTVQFNNTSTVGGTSFANANWNFGNGLDTTFTDVASLFSKTVRFTSPGTFETRLIMRTSQNCYDTAFTQITVNPEPIAAFTSSGNLMNMPVSFTNQSSIVPNQVLLYKWNFGDNSALSQQLNPIHTYSTFGLYPVKLVASTQFGCGDSIVNPISIGSQPVADFNFSALDFCPGTIVNFQNLSTNADGAGLNYLWEFGDNTTATTANVQKQFNTPGTYNVKFTVTSGSGPSNFIIKQVIIRPKPNADYSVSNVCLGEPSIFTDNSSISSGTLTRNWNLGISGNDTTTNTLQYTYTNFGSYNTRLIIVSNFGCSDTAFVTANVEAKPTANFNVSNACAGTQVNFQNTSSIAIGNFSNMWNFGTGSPSATANPVRTYTQAGTYQVSLTVSSNWGCTSTITKPITIHPRPTANYNNTLACFGDSTFFTNTSTISSGTINAFWTFTGNETSIQNNPKFRFPASNNYSVKLTVTSGFGCADSISKFVNVYPSPIADFSFNNVCAGTQVTFTNNSTIPAVGNEAVLSYQWQFGDNSTSLVANPVKLYNQSGNYQVVLEASSVNGCVDYDTAIVQIFAAPVLQFTVADVCVNDTVSINHNIPSNFNFSWTFGDGSNSTNINPSKTYSQSGNYFISLTAQNPSGCSSTVSRALVVHQRPIASFTSANQICANNLITFTNTTSQNQNNTTYAWSFGDSTNSTLANPNKSYSVLGDQVVQLAATNQFGCSSTFNKTITVNPLPTADFAFQGSNINQPVQFTNLSTLIGNATLTTSWQFGNGSASTLPNPTATYVVSGNYPVTLNVTSPQGCSASVTKNVPIAGNETANFTYSGAACPGNNLQFTATSVPPQGVTFTYSWNFGDGTFASIPNPVKSFASVGTYDVELTINPSVGQPSSIIIPVTIGAQPVPSFTVSGNCQNAATNFTNTTVFNHLDYTWNFGDGSSDTVQNPSKNYVLPGTYQVSLTAQNVLGCSATVQQNITIHAVENDLIVDTIRTCGASYPLNAGSGQSYLWTPGNFVTQNIIASSNGKYFIQKTNSNGCIVRDSVVVLLNTTPIINLGADGNYCSGVTLNAGMPGSSFVWSTTANTQTIQASNSGTYWVTATDPNNCIASDTVVITMLSSPMVNFGNDTTICSNQPLVLNATNAGATYAWNDNTTSATRNITQSGLYAVTVTGANTCTITEQIQVTVLTAPVDQIPTSVGVCATDLPLVLNAGGGYQAYNWSTGSTASTANVSTSQIVTLAITHASGCILYDTVAVTVNQNPIIAIADTITVCESTVVNLDAGNAGSTYLWSTQATTQSIQTQFQGLFNVQVTSAQGCVSNKNISIVHLIKPNLSLGQDITVCDNQFPYPVSVTTNGSNINWSTGGTGSTVNVPSAGTYWVNSSFPNGCISSDTIVINQSASPIVNLGNDTTLCQGGTILLNAQNTGSSYQWNGGATSQTLSVNSTGIYTVIVTNTAGCIKTDAIAIGLNPNPIVNLGNDRLLCGNQIVNLDAQNPGATYAWSNGASTQTIQPITSGAYSVTVTDGNGCIGRDTVLVNFFATPIPSLGADINSCNPVSVNAQNPGVSYLWSNGANTQSILINQSGIYTVTMTNSQNCIARDTIIVTIHPAPTKNLGNDTIICAGYSLTLDAGNQGSTFAWNTGATTQDITIQSAGTYIVNITSAFGCINSDTVIVNNNPSPIFNLGNDVNQCAGTSAILTPSSTGANYLWSNGATTPIISVNISGSYWLRVGNSINCFSFDTVQVTFHNAPQVNLGTDISVCDSKLLDAGNPGSTYLWSTNQTTQTITVNQTGNYWARVTSIYGCVNSDTISVQVQPAPQINLGPDITVCDGSLVRLAANVTGAATFQWSTGSSADTISVSTSGIFWLLATGSNGCNTRDTIEVIYSPKPVVSFNNLYTLCRNSITLQSGNLGSAIKWYKNNNLLSTQNQITIADSGFYKIEVINQAGCFAADSFLVAQSPNVVYARFLMPSEIQAGDSVQFINLSFPQPYSSFWNFGDGITATLEDPLHQYAITGNINVRLTVSNGVCTDSISKPLISNQRRKKGNSAKTNLTSYFDYAKMYPNPTNSIFILEAKLNTTADVYVDVHDMRGYQLYFERAPERFIYNKTFNMPYLSNGIYIVRIIVENEIKSFKLIINK